MSKCLNAPSFNTSEKLFALAQSSIVHQIKEGTLFLLLLLPPRSGFCSCLRNAEEGMSLCTFAQHMSAFTQMWPAQVPWDKQPNLQQWDIRLEDNVEQLENYRGMGQTARGVNVNQYSMENVGWSVYPPVSNFFAEAKRIVDAVASMFLCICKPISIYCACLICVKLVFKL